MVTDTESSQAARPIEARDGHRANLYRLLAECYRYPVIELVPTLALLEQEAFALAPIIGESAKELRKNFQKSKGLNQLGVAYSKLFIGPCELIAPPYGSIYMEGRHQVMEDSTLGALTSYVNAGLSPSRNNKEPPDHISTEFEFMYYLGFRYLQFHEQQYVDKQKEFFLGYINPWVPQFCATIARSRADPFYISLATLTTNFMAAEANLYNKGINR